MFSAQNSQISSGVSGNISETVYEVIEDTFPDTTVSEESFEITIRNVAHFFLYFVLGGLIFNALYWHKFERIAVIGFSVIGSMLYALTDEWHQTFVPGRGFEVKDLLIDTLGSIMGVLLIAFIFYRFNKKVLN